MIAIELVPTPTPDLRTLVAALEADLSATYPPEQRHGLDLAAMFQPHIRVFIARRDGQALGCGAVALFPAFAELKRMFVLPPARGTGIVQALLTRLEHEARAAALPRLCLETGDRQHAAMRAYEKAGFTRCPAFGDYAAMPPHSVATSVFYGKPLT